MPVFERPKETTADDTAANATIWIDANGIVHADTAGSTIASARNARDVIQAAVDQVGGRILIKAGVYDIDSTIEVHRSDVWLDLEEDATLNYTASTGAIIEWGDGTNSVANFRVSGGHITTGASTTKTAGAAIHCRNGDRVRIENVTVEDQYRCLYFEETSKRWVLNCELKNFEQDGIVKEGGFDLFIAGLQAHNPDITNTGQGIHVLDGESILCVNSNILHCNNGILLDPATDDHCRWMHFANTQWDSHETNGARLTEANGGNITGVYFENCWWATCGDYGILHEGGSGVRYRGRVLNNDLAGIRITGGQGVKITESDIFSNSASSTNTRDGIEIVGGDGLVVRSSEITNGYDHGDSQRDGIAFEGTFTGRATIEQVDLRGNANLPMDRSEDSTATVIVRDCAGYATKTSGSASVADTGTISHGLDETPAIEDCMVTTASSNRAYVTATSGSDLTIALEDTSGAAVGTAETVYWSATAPSAR